MLARAEVQLIQEGVRPSDFNSRLRAILATRSLEAIRERNSPHQDLLQPFLRKDHGGWGSFRITAGHREEPRPVPVFLNEVPNMRVDSSDATGGDSPPSGSEPSTSRKGSARKGRKRDHLAARLSGDESVCGAFWRC